MGAHVVVSRLYTQTNTVTVSANGKTMTVTSDQDEYCSERNQVRSKHPLPRVGDYTFKIQNGDECGCYDAVALVRPAGRLPVPAVGLDSRLIGVTAGACVVRSAYESP